MEFDSRSPVTSSPSSLKVITLKENQDLNSGTVCSAYRSNETGLAMFVTVFMALVLGMVSAVTVTTTLTRNKDSRFQLDRIQARSLAEAILDAAQKQILVRTANFDDPFVTSTSASGVVTIGGQDYSWNGVDLTPSVYPGEVDSNGWRSIDVLYDSTNGGGSATQEI